MRYPNEQEDWSFRPLYAPEPYTFEVEEIIYREIFRFDYSGIFKWTITNIYIVDTDSEESAENIIRNMYFGEIIPDRSKEKKSYEYVIPNPQLFYQNYSYSKSFKAKNSCYLATLNGVVYEDVPCYACKEEINIYSKQIGTNDYGF